MATWQPRFLYRDLLQLDDIAFAGSTAVSGMPETNMAVDQPSKAMRTTTVSPYTVLSAGTVSSQQHGWDTMFVGYTNFTPKRNLLRYSNTLSNAVWTAEATTVAISTIDPFAPVSGSVWRITASGGTSAHGIYQIWTPALAPAAAQQYTVSFYVSLEETPRPDQVRVFMYANVTDSVYVDLDVATRTIGSATAAGGWSDASATLEDGLEADSYRIIVSGTYSSAITTLRAWCRMGVGGSFNFAQAGEKINLMQGFLDVGDNSAVEDATESENAAGVEWGISGPTVVSEREPAVARDLTEKKDTAGWVHGVVLVRPSVTYTKAWIVNIEDPNNEDSYIEVGRWMIGKSFQPTGALVGADSTHKGAMPGIRRTWEAGRWVWEIDFDYLTADTAEREFMEMYRYANKNDDGSPSVRSAGGQRYSPRKGVLFIADTGAGTSEPERVIYGELLGSAPIASTINDKSRITVRIGEFPK